MLLVILGAGASYDSSATLPPPSRNDLQRMHRPPLTNELFSNRKLFGDVMKKYPRVQDVALRLRHLRQGQSVETTLKALQAETETYLDRFQQIASIRYYLREVIATCGADWLGICQGLLNHHQLIDDIKRTHNKNNRVCFVTFNYDLLIDEAFRHAGIPLQDFPSYIRNEFMLVKLHGSVNWGRIELPPISWTPSYGT